jgi:hypothetical protein
VHLQAGEAVELVLRQSIASKTLDNITAVVVCFANFKDAVSRKYDNDEGKKIFHPTEHSHSDTGGPQDFIDEEMFID